jgi:O-antigen/teichoic acid export membrane protein
MTLSRLFKLLVFDMGARIIGSVLVLFIQLELARNYTAADVAAVLLTMSVASLLSLAVSGGHSFVAIAQIAKFRSRGMDRLEALFHRIAFGDMVVLFLIVAAIVLGCLAAFNFSRAMGLALLFGLASTPFSAMLRYNALVAISVGRYQLSYLDNYLRPGLFAALVGLNAVLDWQLDVVHIIAGYVLANATAAVILHALLRKDTIKFTQVTFTANRFSSAMRGRAFALFCVLGIAGTLSDFITFLAGVFLDVDDVAKVGIAVRLAAVAGFAIQSVQQFSLADLAKLRGADQLPLLRRANLLMIATMIAGVAGAIVLGPFVLSWFGEEYVSAHFALVLFMVAQVVRAGGGLNQNLLTLAGQHMHALSASVLSLAALVISWMAVVPWMTLAGAGLASIIAEAAAAVSLAIIAQRRIGYRGDALAVFRAGQTGPW